MWRDAVIVESFGIEVQCYSGYRGEQEPRQFHVGTHSVEVVDIIDRWLAPEHRYFKVRGADGGVYILRHDEKSGRWEITLYGAG